MDNTERHKHETHLVRSEKVKGKVKGLPIGSGSATGAANKAMNNSDDNLSHLILPFKPQVINGAQH